MSELVLIDALTSRPHVRHWATVTDMLRDNYARTLCGRMVIYWFDATDTSLTYTDGTVYARLCPICERRYNEMEE